MPEEPTQEEQKKSFWTTLPGVLTAAATFITAVTGLIAILPDSKPHGPTPPPATTSPSFTDVTSTVPTSTPLPPVSFPDFGGCSFIGATNPVITLSRSSARKGEQVTVTGKGFCPADIIDFSVHVSDVGETTTDAKGGFVKTITIPQNAPNPGFPTDISADSRAHKGHASAPFTMA